MHVEEFALISLFDASEQQCIDDPFQSYNATQSPHTSVFIVGLGLFVGKPSLKAATQEPPKAAAYKEA